MLRLTHMQDFRNINGGLNFDTARDNSFTIVLLWCLIVLLDICVATVYFKPGRCSVRF